MTIQRTVLVVGLALAGVVVLFPPWVGHAPEPGSGRDLVWRHGFAPLFAPPRAQDAVEHYLTQYGGPDSALVEKARRTFDPRMPFGVDYRRVVYSIDGMSLALELLGCALLTGAAALLARRRNAAA